MLAPIMTYLGFLRANANWLAAGFLLAFTSSYGQTFFISLFADEVMTEFGLSHGQWGGAYTLGTLVSAIVMVWAGILTDRYRVRVLAPAVFAGLALVCMAMAANRAAWALPLIIFGLRFTGQGMSTHLSSVAMARWFTASRGRALAISSMGFAVGTALLPVAFVWAKDWFDWRQLWLVAAAMALAAILPLVALLRRERTPQGLSESSDAVGMDGRHWTRMQMIRHPLFWMLFPAIFGPAAWNTALFFHQVHLAASKGWTHAEFVALIPVFTLVAVVSTFASGWAADRFGPGWLMALQAVPSIAGYALLASTSDLGAGLLAMCLVALSAGTMATLPGTFAATYYGTRHIGAIKSVWAAVMVLGSAIGPGLTGLLIDRGHDFADQMLGISTYFALSVLLLSLAVLNANRTLPPAAEIDVIRT